MIANSNRRRRRRKSRKHRGTGNEPPRPTLQWQAPSCPDELKDTFWHPGLDTSPSKWTSHYERVIATGFQLPPAESLGDEQLSAKLWARIQALARLRVFLVFTNHLSDRQLYQRLCTETLHDRIKNAQFPRDCVFVIGLLNPLKPQHVITYLQYYADDQERNQLARRCPGIPIPGRAAARSDRDRHLPHP